MSDFIVNGYIVVLALIGFFLMIVPDNNKAEGHLFNVFLGFFFVLPLLMKAMGL